ncbi:hypothetical protein [Maribacter sp. 2-571]|uniref:hypothetical protein n=1 Tax=Maribacter sp. 2-571 TaxID=3417569 RepID=UPI003D358D08
MKKLSVVVAAVVLFCSANVFANNGKKGTVKKNAPTEVKSLSYQIHSFLKFNNLTQETVGETAHITFMLNNDKEIVVLSVDTEDSKMDTFVKSRLNYKKVVMNGYVAGKKYTVSVRIAS